MIRNVQRKSELSIISNDAALVGKGVGKLFDASLVSTLTASHIGLNDRRLLEVRVRQLRHPRAHARIPAPRTVHQVGNVSVVDAAESGDVRVGSTLVLVEYRRERQRVWGALVEHRLRRSTEGLRIAAKRVDLVNSEAELDGIVCLF